MTWSTDKPTKPGFYWYRTHDCETEIMKVTGNRNDRLWAQSTDDGFDGALPVKHLHGEWFGPLEIPE